jgi:hypothetical protein
LSRFGKTGTLLLSKIKKLCENQCWFNIFQVDAKGRQT